MSHLWARALALAQLQAERPRSTNIRQGYFLTSMCKVTLAGHTWSYKGEYTLHWGMMFYTSVTGIPPAMLAASSSGAGAAAGVPVGPADGPAARIFMSRAASSVMSGVGAGVGTGAAAAVVMSMSSESSAGAGAGTARAGAVVLSSASGAAAGPATGAATGAAAGAAAGLATGLAAGLATGAAADIVEDTRARSEVAGSAGYICRASRSHRQCIMGIQ